MRFPGMTTWRWKPFKLRRGHPGAESKAHKTKPAFQAGGNVVAAGRMVLSAFPATALHGPWDAGPEGALCPTPASPMQPAPRLPLAWACAAACLRPISTAKLFLPRAGQAGCFLSCRQSWFWQEEGGVGEAQETSSRAAWEPALGVMTPRGGKVLPHLFLVIGHIAGHAASDSVPRRSVSPVCLAFKEHPHLDALAVVDTPPGQRPQQQRGGGGTGAVARGKGQCALNVNTHTYHRAPEVISSEGGLRRSSPLGPFSWDRRSFHGYPLCPPLSTCPEP